MRILIFSDLHANLETLLALQQVEHKPDALLFLGDAVGYGPDPAPCVAWLAQNVTRAVQGDHDLAAASGADCDSPDEWLELAHATRDMNRRVLTNRALEQLRALPASATLELGGARFWMTHHLAGMSDPLTAPEEAVRSLIETTGADIILFGHTHVPLLRRVGQTWLVNPGSLGQPRHGLPSATYAVWNDGECRIYHIDYDPQKTIEKLGLLPLDPEQAVRLQATLRRGM